MNESIEFDYLLSEETLRAAESVSRQGDVRVALQYALGVIGGFMVLGSLRGFWVEGFGLRPIVSMVFGCMGVLWFPPLSRRWMKRVIARLPQVGKRAWVKVTQDGVSYSVEEGQADSVPWASIKRAVISESGILLKARGAGELWLPYEPLKSHDCEDQLLAVVRKNVSRIRNVRTV